MSRKLPFSIELDPIVQELLRKDQNLTTLELARRASEIMGDPVTKLQAYQSRLRLNLTSSDIKHTYEVRNHIRELLSEPSTTEPKESTLVVVSSGSTASFYEWIGMPVQNDKDGCRVKLGNQLVLLVEGESASEPKTFLVPFHRPMMFETILKSGLRTIPYTFTRDLKFFEITDPDGNKIHIREPEPSPSAIETLTESTSESPRPASDYSRQLTIVERDGVTVVVRGLNMNRIQVTLRRLNDDETLWSSAV